MRRRRRLRLVDTPRLLIGGAVQFASLFSGRYQRSEGAHALTTDGGGRILVVQTTYLGPGWMLPGGRVERAEAPHVAAARETREETGIVVDIDRLVLLDARTPSSVSFIFRGTVVGGELDPQFGEIAEAGWVGRDEIAQTSAPLHQLLELIDDAGDGVVYLGLDHRHA
ncbi:MAG: NUDIX domain-containing protein [Candidatus Limnocylindria bacterium]